MAPRRALFLLLAAGAGALSGVAASSRAAFERWKAAHGKRYASAAAEERRYGHWRVQFEHVERHRRHQQSQKEAQHHYELGLNEWSDLSPEEHKARFLASGFVPPGWRDGLDFSHPRVFNGDSSDPLPAVDWRQPASNPKGVKAVTPVRNQGYW